MTSTILLVEDQPDLLNHLSLTLEMAGYHTIMANDGLEAMEILKRRTIDLIISDIAMPDMDGYQFRKQVCGNPKWVDIPFLFLTGCRFLSDGEIHYGKSLGVEEYLTKPIRAKTLLSTVEQMLQPANIYQTPLY